ncbi:MAG: NADH:flavin oxidoreductase [Armatimonadetes bacterium]|nr:NADH:flavin oxidoreductase [Armatimonadota bacterium]
MWTPADRIRHELPSGDWPTAAQAESSLLFSPIQVGPVQLEQRTWVPAMVPWRATEEGFVTPDILRWYERFAMGQPGAIVVEATGVRDIKSGPLLRIGHDRFVPGLEQLVGTVRRASSGRTRLFLQLIDFLTVRRRPEKEKFFLRFLRIEDRHREALAGLAEGDEAIRQWLIEASDEEHERALCARELEDLRYGYRERVTDTHLPHVRELPEVLPGIFAQAAVRAREAGFDGVELHYAHAYTMASFLSALNTRTDGFGGPRENRVRVALEAYRAVRQAVGHDVAVGCRFLTRDAVAGGSTVEDSEYFGVEFARDGMDFLSLSRGGRFEDAKQPKVGWAVYPYTGPSGYECMPTVLSDRRGPFGRNVEEAARIRTAIREAGFQTPVVVTGGICSFAQAEALLRTGSADVVGAARQSLADPDWYLKMRLGRGEEIRRCKYTNYCEGLDGKHKQVTCQLWDRLNLSDPDAELAEDGRRRLTAPLWESRAAPGVKGSRKEHREADAPPGAEQTEERIP